MGTTKRCLISRAEIARRVAELGERLGRDYAGPDLVMVGVLKGVFIFMADLVRRPALAHALLDRLTDLLLANVERYIEAGLKYGKM